MALKDELARITEQLQALPDVLSVAGERFTTLVKLDVELDRLGIEREQAKLMRFEVTHNKEYRRVSLSVQPISIAVSDTGFHTVTMIPRNGARYTLAQLEPRARLTKKYWVDVIAPQITEELLEELALNYTR